MGALKNIQIFADRAAGHLRGPNLIRVPMMHRVGFMERDGWGGQSIVVKCIHSGEITPSVH
jgi:hypothetical protein